MARIGFVGLGKLGLPVALAIESKGHDVIGYDINPEIANYIKNKQIPYKEKDLQPLLNVTEIDIVDLETVVLDSNIIFCPIQTPHKPEFEGSTRLPDERADFDYTYLIEAIENIIYIATNNKKKVCLAVISTCLPGTYQRLIEPILNEWVEYIYTPQFIAMGTVLEDYLHPEFNLIGSKDIQLADDLEKFYKTINEAPSVKTDITTAEGIKVSYNTWITAKTVIANLWGEIAHKTGMNFDDIHKAWSLSHKRLLSNRYINSGVGDGGGCHPRDNIALSYIAKQINLSHNIFEDLMLSREQHMEWIADEALKHGKSITILGRAFKPETNIETGSPSILLANILLEKGATIQHIEDIHEATSYDPVVIIGTKHDRYSDYRFWPGTIVIDPFRYIIPNDDIKVISIG